LKDYADRADSALDVQKAVIEDQSKEIQTLRRQVAELNDHIGEAVTRADDMAAQYRKTWVKDNGPTTPLSILRWESEKERRRL